MRTTVDYETKTISSNVTHPDGDECIGVSRVDAAWAAGFFDGEGCIIGARQPHRGQEFALVVSVAQNDTRPLEHLRELFGGAVLCKHRRGDGDCAGKGHSWQVSGGYARNFLSTVEPHLRVKGERARLALSVSPERLWSQPNRRGTLVKREVTA